ncbi:Uncharacterised protein [Mycobacterium tuberculosis]|nr:Uncharacterised protein [Mycobacterium tuberculosis]
MRVDPEVYCKYAVDGYSSSLKVYPFGASRSSKSTSIIDGGDSPGRRATCCTTSSTADDVVRMATGDESLSTESERSSVTPPCGTESGTAMRPACNAPRKATTYSSPCGAEITTRSPVEPQRLSSCATFSVRRYSCDHVRVIATPSQSCS